MKILFIGDYSNLHACLAEELRREGHYVNVLSDRGGYMDTHADFYLARTPGIVGGAKYLYRLYTLLPRLRGYDVVQIINPNFLSLRPAKIKYFFDRLRRQNGAMFLTLAGNDYFYVKACMEGKMFRFSEFMVGDKPTEYLATEAGRHMLGWISDVNHRWNSYVYEHIDGAMSVLPEYDMASRPLFGDRLAFTNIPIDLSNLEYAPNAVEGKVKIFVGMRSGMEVQKGTGILLGIARELEKEMPDRVVVERVSDVSLKEYLRLMKGSNIVLDQLYAYAPATNALQAMALGKVAGSGGQPEYYDYIGKSPYRPVFTLSPTDTGIKENLRALVSSQEELRLRGEFGRRIVEQHNDVRVVAAKFLAHWQRLS